MRFAYSLGLGLALAGPAGAQTTATPANPQPETGNRIPADQAAIALPPALYQMGDVGKSLRLTQDQINRLNGVTQKMRTQYAPQLEKLGTLSEAERFARIQELNRLYSADWYKSASDIFNDQQRTRYHQLTTDPAVRRVQHTLRPRGPETPEPDAGAGEEPPRERRVE
jgi:hypothetical protein